MRVPFAQNRIEDFAEFARADFDLAACALRFEGDARRMLLDFKFNRHLWMRVDFVDWLEAVARIRYDVAAIDCVVPVPTGMFHRLDRGFDACAMLARPLARRLDRPCLTNVMRRCGRPARQSSLGEEERVANVRGTIATARPGLIRGRTVLVVDDVLTTGSTLSECASMLKAAGAWRVWGLTLARSVRD